MKTCVALQKKTKFSGAMILCFQEPGTFDFSGHVCGTSESWANLVKCSYNVEGHCKLPIKLGCLEKIAENFIVGNHEQTLSNILGIL